jgi:hypothetical protein
MIAVETISPDCTTPDQLVSLAEGIALGFRIVLRDSIPAATVGVTLRDGKALVEIKRPSKAVLIPLWVQGDQIQIQSWEFPLDGVGRWEHAGPLDDATHAHSGHDASEQINAG